MGKSHRGSKAKAVMCDRCKNDLQCPYGNPVTLNTKKEKMIPGNYGPRPKIIMEENS